MDELIKQIKKDGWELYSTNRHDAYESKTYHHKNSAFALTLNTDSFKFHGNWKMINFETKWIKFSSLDHFNIFDGQTTTLDGLIFKFLK